MKPPVERRTDRIRLLARIDQAVASTEYLLANPRLAPEQRAFFRVNLVTQRRAQKRVKQMLDDTA
jgi:hypothetical protein